MGKIMRNGTEYGGGLPTGGTPGQVLTKTATGAEWADAQGGGGSNILMVNYGFGNRTSIAVGTTQHCGIEEVQNP